MVRKTKRNGGMIKNIMRPIGKATVTLGESIGKDYLQKKSIKVAQGIYDEPTLVKKPSFILTGNKPLTNPTFSFYDKENINPNIGGKSTKHKRKYTINSRKKHRRNVSKRLRKIKY